MSPREAGEGVVRQRVARGDKISSKIFGLSVVFITFVGFWKGGGNVFAEERGDETDNSVI